MATGAQQTDSDPKAEANHCMREMWQKGKSLKYANAQWTCSDLMAILQRRIKLMVGVEHQTTTYLQSISVQWIDHGLMAVLQ